jgi:hypothetical protein
MPPKFASPGTDLDLGVVCVEMAEYLADGAMLIVQIKHQADRGLRLLIRTKDNLTVGAAHISHRHCSV